ncbi:hypothetical protein VOLCADRAFT_99673 [Volvox carteri f. nagariensis]|uniref:DUF962 domain-containing protein n=1 Tax=Volvox carteri f. nagariensis TaxID=3068 RepID=D8UIC1_VOLCA|nr:uncharacterized protein VOLCADRAFT_99673 [Volvox carteri f. nagariensis]EFJ40561.1 hypothetical protein VOLCADRAFT_99673 [Volvox carteri f. nagariensis]|eukprot:XP_002958411.1 hypothetical protein VOLCADRAFT_99673 [Volvox carteri f. nagariensis]
MYCLAPPPGSSVLPRKMRRYNTFEEFYPFYLTQHRRLGTRVLHIFGTSLVLLNAGWALVARQPRLLLLAPVLGYGPAWLSHMLCECNRPATFQYPLWSLMADFKMFVDILRGRERLSA